MKEQGHGPPSLSFSPSVAPSKADKVDTATQPAIVLLAPSLAATASLARFEAGRTDSLATKKRGTLLPPPPSARHLSSSSLSPLSRLPLHARLSVNPTAHPSSAVCFPCLPQSGGEGARLQMAASLLFMILPQLTIIFYPDLSICSVILLGQMCILLPGFRVI